MFDKPVINVAYNPTSVSEREISYRSYYEFDHYKPIVASGAVRVARSEREMLEFLRSSLEHPATESAERKNLISEMFGNTLDGKSSVRVADTLLQLAGA